MTGEPEGIEVTGREVWISLTSEAVRGMMEWADDTADLIYWPRALAKMAGARFAALAVSDATLELYKEEALVSQLLDGVSDIP